MISKTPIVLAIDPGRSKCGVALVDRAGAVLYRAVTPIDSLPAILADLSERFPPQAVIIGNGTGSSMLRRLLETLNLPAPLVEVEEKHTSEQARVRYLDATPVRGWRRLLPRALRVPETAYDDYVAIILAERWWKTQTGED